MGKLYDISIEFEELFDVFDKINSQDFDTDADGNCIDKSGNIIDPVECTNTMLQAWYDTLEGMEMEFIEVAENMGVYLKQLKAECEAIQKEEKNLKQRREVKDKQLEGMKQYLKFTMEKMKLQKIDTPKARVSLRNNPEKLIIDSEMAFIHWAESADETRKLLKYSDPAIRKDEVKSLLKEGEIVPHVHLEREKSLIIK